MAGRIIFAQCVHASVVLVGRVGRARGAGGRQLAQAGCRFCAVVVCQPTDRPITGRSAAMMADGGGT